MSALIGIIIIMAILIVLVVMALCNISGKASNAEEALHGNEETEN